MHTKDDLAHNLNLILIYPYLTCNYLLYLALIIQVPRLTCDQGVNYEAQVLT